MLNAFNARNPKLNPVEPVAGSASRYKMTALVERPGFEKQYGVPLEGWMGRSKSRSPGKKKLGAPAGIAEEESIISSRISSRSSSSITERSLRQNSLSLRRNLKPKFAAAPRPPSPKDEKPSRKFYNKTWKQKPIPPGQDASTNPNIFMRDYPEIQHHL